MTTVNKIAAQNTNTTLFILVVVMFLLSCTGVFAQNNTAAANTTTTEVTIEKNATTITTTDNTVAASMDFAVWFMGSNKSSNETNNGTFSKKQLINSGINTNSVLIRTFLKVVISQGNNVA